MAPNQPSEIVIQENTWNELTLHEKRVIYGLTLRGKAGSMFRIRIAVRQNPSILTVRENGKIQAWMALFLNNVEMVVEWGASRSVYFFTRKCARRKGYGQLLQDKLIDIAQHAKSDKWVAELFRKSGHELKMEYILRPWDSTSRAFFAKLLQKAEKAGVTNIYAMPSLQN